MSLILKSTDQFYIFHAAVALIIRLLLSPFRSYDHHKSWSRVASDESFRFFSSRLRVNQMQYIMGTTPAVYMAWAEKNKRHAIIDDLDDSGSLMWFTDRRTTGKVVFYFHGRIKASYPASSADSIEIRRNISTSYARICPSFLALYFKRIESPYWRRFLLRSSQLL